MFRVIKDTTGKGAIDTAIAFDNTASSGALTNLTSVSFNYTCNGNLLVVCVSCLNLLGEHSATYGGVPLTLWTEQENSSVNSHVFYLVNPPTGVNNLTVTASVTHNWIANVVSYSGVDQYHPFEGTANNFGTGGNTVNNPVTTAHVGDWVLNTIATQRATISAGQTSRQNIGSAAGSGGVEDTNGPVAIGTTTMSYSGVTGSNLWAMSAVALQPTGVTIPISVSDSSATSENLGQAESALKISTNDSTTTSENLSELNRFYINVNDAEVVTDIPLYNPDLVYVLESVPSPIINYHIGVSEDTTTSDVVTPGPVPNPPVNDTVSTSEVILLAFGGDIFVISEPHVAESLSMSPVPNPSAFDDVAVTESFPVNITRLFLSVLENVTTSESESSQQVYTLHAFDLPHVVDFPGFYPDDTTVTEYTQPTILSPFNQIVGESVPVFENSIVRLMTRPFANPNQQLVIKIATKNF